MGSSAGVHRWVRRAYEGAAWGVPALVLSVVVGVAVFVWFAGPEAWRYGVTAGALLGIWLAVFVAFAGVLIKTDMVTGATYILATMALIVVAVRHEPAVWLCLPLTPAFAGCVGVVVSPAEHLESLTAD